MVAVNLQMFKHMLTWSCFIEDTTEDSHPQKKDLISCSRKQWKLTKYIQTANANTSMELVWGQFKKPTALGCHPPSRAWNCPAEVLPWTCCCQDADNDVDKTTTTTANFLRWIMFSWLKTMTVLSSGQGPNKTFSNTTPQPASDLTHSKYYWTFLFTMKIEFCADRQSLHVVTWHVDDALLCVRIFQLLNVAADLLHQPHCFEPYWAHCQFS